MAIVSVMKEMRTETAHRLLNYAGKCAHLHGHSYLWQVTVCSSLPADDGDRMNRVDKNGMLLDFKHVKEAMMAVIDPLDHALVLCKDDPLFLALRGRTYEESRRKSESDEVVRTILEVVRPTFPTRATRATRGEGDVPRLFVCNVNPTAENLALWASWALGLELQRRVSGAIGELYVSEVSLWETATSKAVVTAIPGDGRPIVTLAGF